MKKLFKTNKKQKPETSNAHDDGLGCNLVEINLNRLHQHHHPTLPSTSTAPVQMQAVSSPCSTAPELDVNDVMVSRLASDFTQMQVGHSGSGPSASTLGHTMATTNPTALEHKPSKNRKRSRISSRVTIGQEIAFNEVCDCLNVSEVGMVGIYGMGGVGKTTLMEKLCYEFLKRSNFKVIWIVVSRPVNVGAIQRSIMEELNLKFNKDQDPKARGMDINETLFNSNDRVALLLDDIWESLDLEELGVAGGFELDTSKFKIIFTTRSEDVCLQMNPDQKMKIKRLGPKESWALFKQSVGEKTLNSHHQILGLAEEVAKECAGLPLALTIIGKAMVCKTSPEAWEDALKSLRNCLSLISGAEKNLFERLKFSYDNLQNQVEKDCFLFCCMYPEDKVIDKDKLVGSWIGEGLLDVGYGTYEETWNRGHGIIDTLVAKSLLEFYDVRRVKMHDVIRDMGLWIGSESNYFVHTANLKLSGQEITRRWNTARWIYVEDHNDDLPQELDCPNLSTLHVNCRTNESDMVGIMNSMNDKYDVKVLIMEFDWFRYSPIPTFGQFVGLRHLEINFSIMEALPDDIGNLTKLLVLILLCNRNLSTLPPTIGGLCELRKLQIRDCDDLENIPLEVGKLKKLEMVDISAPTAVYKGNIFNDCTELRRLHLKVKNLTELPNGLAYNCKKLEKLFIKTRNVMRPEDGPLFIEGLKRLTSLKVLTVDGWPIADGDEVIFAIGAICRLRELRITRCDIDKLVIPEEIDFLPQLEVLEIRYCHRLEKVHFRKRALQSLCILKIGYCERLAHVVGLQHLLRLRELDIAQGFVEGLITTTDDDGHGLLSDVQTHSASFPNLQRLRLQSLRRMKLICNDNVSFPCLYEFRLYKCPIVAPGYQRLANADRWLNFHGVQGVSIYGGTLDGQGAALWSCKSGGRQCPSGAGSLAFTNSRNILVSDLTSVNSELAHLVLDECTNCKVQGVRIQAAANSPNTDGIHVQGSTGVTILNTNIKTGDDCVSIGPGTMGLVVDRVSCGPGHGISIGSLGKSYDEDGVQNVTVSNTEFTGTENGLRIKSWGRASNGFVRGVTFEHALMRDVENPIIINQNYCPHEHDCPGQSSGVEISGVTYNDIRGTSATEVAVKFDCSVSSPCSGIELQG